jgi:hypothetical protein
MLRRLATATAAASFSGAILLLGAGTAAAAPPTGGCPSGGDWSLVPIEFTIPGFDKGNFHDQNGDGYVCQKSHKDGSWTLKDNTNP